MVRQTPWVEREFEFKYPIGLFPGVIARLWGTPARLEEFAESLPVDVLTAKIDHGWSIQEVIGHLGDVEELHNGRLDDFLSGAEMLRAANMANSKTARAAHNKTNIRELLMSFRGARLNFVRRLEELDEKAVVRTALHPRLKTPMRIIDMAFFVAEHDDHHVAAILEIIRRLA
ncbi:MAG: DinB family protein [candidate division Zixibacteria bacterium]|nr:DinB family protein [candidate division Zixibacteria bacterium]